MERFNDQQMKRILEKSLELERHAQRSLSSRKEYSADEILGMARDLGVSESSLRSAIASEKAEAPSYSSFIGGPTLIECQTNTGGVNEGELHRIVRQLPAIVGVAGTGSVEAGSLHWEAEIAEALRGLRCYTIEIIRRGEGMDIVIHNRLDTAAGGIFGGTMGTVTIGASLLGLPLLQVSPLFMIAFAILALGPAYMIAKRAYAMLVGRARKRMGAILEAVAAALSDE
jgi:hypothetical protein